MGEKLSFSPGWFQLPNWFVDEVAPYLTDQELRVMLFAMRHVLGWQKKISSRQSHISMSMFMNGYRTADGTYFAGTFYAEATIRNALRSLVKHGMLERVGDPVYGKGQLWYLPEEFDTDNLEGLKERLKEHQLADMKRTEKASHVWREQGYVARNPSGDNASDSENEANHLTSDDTHDLTSDDTQTKTVGIHLLTTRSSGDLDDPEDIGLPSLAGASDVDPKPTTQSLDNRYPNRPIANIEEINRLRGKGKAPQRDDSTAEENAPEDADAQSQLRSVKTPRKPSPLSQAQAEQMQKSHSAGQSEKNPKTRALFQELANLIGKTISDSEQKNLCARRDLEWRGKSTVAKPAADLWDNDPHFQEYVRWMVKQATDAGLTISAKMIVGMLRNYNRGDESAPGKIAGWWLWEETHPRPSGVGGEVDVEDAEAAWVRDPKRPPRAVLEKYYCEWSEKKGQWVKVIAVAEMDEDVRQLHLDSLKR